MCSGGQAADLLLKRLEYEMTDLQNVDLLTPFSQALLAASLWLSVAWKCSIVTLEFRRWKATEIFCSKKLPGVYTRHSGICLPLTLSIRASVYPLNNAIAHSDTAHVRWRFDALQQLTDSVQTDTEPDELVS